MNSLWIRSQNKGILAKVNCIYIDEKSNKKYTVLCGINKNTELYLGTYSYDRALKILDTIQKILTPTIISKPIVKETTKPQSVTKTFEQVGSDIEIRELNTIVFEMPED